MFSSIPTERRNSEFKLDVTHCFEGWKLSRQGFFLPTPSIKKKPAIALMHVISALPMFLTFPPLMLASFCMQQDAAEKSVVLLMMMNNFSFYFFCTWMDEESWKLNLNMDFECIMSCRCHVFMECILSCRVSWGFYFGGYSMWNVEFMCFILFMECVLACAWHFSLPFSKGLMSTPILKKL